MNIQGHLAAVLLYILADTPFYSKVVLMSFVA